MGSQQPSPPPQASTSTALPDATSPTLLLAHPTDAEKRQTWTLNHGEWGGALSLQEYLEREPYLTTIPLAADGGMTHWILTTGPPGPDGEGDVDVSAGNGSGTGSGTSGGGGGGGGGGSGSGERPVLASCESTQKRVLYASPDGGDGDGDGDGDGVVVREGVGFGVASVYTYPRHRGRGYASRMLRELGATLRTWQRDGGEDGENEETAVCSALWSDIGKQYYAKLGWVPCPSWHVEFPVSAGTATATTTTATEETAPDPTNDTTTTPTTTPITYTTLPALCAADESIVRAQVFRAARRTGRTAFAFAPDHDALRWHLYRDDFIASLVFPVRERSKVKGAVAVTGDDGKRVWAVWTRNYASRDTDDGAAVARNTLYILRLVIEDSSSTSSTSSSDAKGRGSAAGGKAGDDDEAEEEDDDDDEKLVQAFTAVMREARREAASWRLGKIDLWNPGPRVKRLIERSGLEHGLVERDTDSVPSLMWYGREDVREVEWVGNEKYCWC